MALRKAPAQAMAHWTVGLQMINMLAFARIQMQPALNI